MSQQPSTEPQELGTCVYGNGNYKHPKTPYCIDWKAAAGAAQTEPGPRTDECAHEFMPPLLDGSTSCIRCGKPFAQPPEQTEPGPLVKALCPTCHNKGDELAQFKCPDKWHDEPVAAQPPERTGRLTAEQFYEAHATNIVNVPRPGYPEDKSGWDGVRRASEAKFIAGDALVMTLPDAFDAMEAFRDASEAQEPKALWGWPIEEIKSAMRQFQSQHARKLPTDVEAELRQREPAEGDR